MYRRSLVLCMFVAAATWLATAADKSQPGTKLSAAEIVDKNVSARGGLAAWRSVKTLSMSAKIDAGGNSRPVLPLRRSRKDRTQPIAAPRPVEQVQLPMLIELKRSHKSRIELQFNGQTAIQAYDGTNGWKIRPFLNRNDVEPFSADELKAASLEADIDGPLVDYQAKGSKVELVGSEKVGERDTYKLAITTRSGQVQHIWIDAQSFLEVKMEGTPRRLDGKMHPVEVYYEDFRPASGGVVLPYLYETRVEGVKQTEKMRIESVLVNPKLDDTLFAKPR